MIFRLLSSAFLVAALMGVGLTPLPSAAQSEYEVAVSNIYRGHSQTERRAVPIAQVFTTGTRSGGYRISSVELRYDDVQGDEFSAAIHAVGSDGFPTDTVVLQLETEYDFSSTGIVTFTPAESPGDFLDGETKYAVVVEGTDSDSEIDYRSTRRGRRLDCRVPPCALVESIVCPPRPQTCNNNTPDEYGWAGWKINPKLSVWRAEQSVWQINGVNEIDYYNNNIALMIRISSPRITGPPRNLNAISTSRGVILSWDSPELSGESPITGYRHRSRLADGSAEWGDWKIKDKRVRPVTVSGLDKNVEYEFQVQAGNLGGWSESSSSVFATWIDGPPAPYLSWTNEYIKGSIDVTWEPSPSAARYDIKWKCHRLVDLNDGWASCPDRDSSDEQEAWENIGDVTEFKVGDWTKSGSGTSSSYSHWLISDGREYRVTVRGVDSEGNAGSESSVDVTARRAPGKPTEVRAEAYENHIKFDWLSPFTNHYHPYSEQYHGHVGLGKVSRDKLDFEYRVDGGEWHSVNDSWQRLIMEPPSKDTIYLNNLESSRDYRIEVRSVSLDNGRTGSSVSVTEQSGFFTSDFGLRRQVTEVKLKTSDVVKRSSNPDPNHPGHHCSLLSVRGWDFDCFWIVGSGPYRIWEEFEDTEFFLPSNIVFVDGHVQIIPAKYKIKRYCCKEGTGTGPEDPVEPYPLKSGDIIAMSLAAEYHHHGEWVIARLTNRLPSSVVRLETPGMSGYLEALADGTKVDLVWVTTYPASTSYDIEWSTDSETWQSVDPLDDGGGHHLQSYWSAGIHRLLLSSSWRK